MSSSQCVNRGRACIVVNRDNYSEYYMCVHILCQVTFLCYLEVVIELPDSLAKLAPVYVIEWYMNLKILFAVGSEDKK